MTTTIVMTGATSGIGLAAARELCADGARLIRGVRRPPGWAGPHDAAPAGRPPVPRHHRRRGDDAPAPIDLDLDLSSLASVRDFAEQVSEVLGEDPVHALVLNAGTIRGDVAARSEDGHELTVATNHLGAYLLLRLLLPRLPRGGRVVMTSSGAHDPEQRSRLAPPRHGDVDLLAAPERDGLLDPRPWPAAQHAYTASKLLTVLTVLALADSRTAGEQAWTVVAYDPGQVLGTGLVRELPPPVRLAWWTLGTPVGAPLRRVGRRLGTAAQAGAGMADLALGRVRPPRGEHYAVRRGDGLVWRPPSELARTPDLAQVTWETSAALVGLPCDDPC